MRIACGFAGPPGSGKTTVSTSLAEQFDAICLSFGDYVRSQAQAQSMEADRAHLQVLGSDLLAGLGPDGLVREVLGSKGATAQDLPAFWDGIRHPSVLAALKKLYLPAPFVLVLLQQRNGGAPAFGNVADDAIEAQRLSCHETESHLAELEASADLVISEGSSAAATETVARWLANSWPVARR